MLNLVHTFGATKKEFRGKGGSFAPSALCADTTKGTCTEMPCISVYYNHSAKKYHLFTEQQLKAPQTSTSAVMSRGSVCSVPASSGGGGRRARGRWRQAAWLRAQLHAPFLMHRLQGATGAFRGMGVLV
jgi:hypothetical protein